MRKSIVLTFALSVVALAGCASGGGRVSTDDGLTLDFAADGRLAGLLLDGRPQKLPGGGFALRYAGDRREWPPWLTGHVAPLGNNCIGFTSDPVEHVRVVATIKGGPYIDVRGRLIVDDNADHAVRLAFLLPAREIKYATDHAFEAPVLEGEERTPAPTKAMVSVPSEPGIRFMDQLPFLALAAPNTGALALAVPTHQPVCFSWTRFPGAGAVTWSLGVAPSVKDAPRSAEFRLAIYRADEHWPTRSAAERYYQFFPEVVAGHAPDHGTWASADQFAGNKLTAEQAERFAVRFVGGDFTRSDFTIPPDLAKTLKDFPVMVFQQGRPAVFAHAVAEALTAPVELALLRTRAAIMPPTSRAAATQTDAERPRRGRLGATSRPAADHSERSVEAARAAVNSYLTDATGNLIWCSYKDGARLLPMSLDPDLPRPNRWQWSIRHQFANTDQLRNKDFAGPFNVALLGLDDGWGFEALDYRREHFATAGAPLVTSPGTGALALWNGASTFKGVAALADMLHSTRLLVAADISPRPAMVLSPLLDLFARDRSLDDADASELEAMRLLAGQRPVIYTRPDYKIESLARAATWAIFPGVAAERAGQDYGALVSRYLLAMQQMARAGWQPVTAVRAQPDAIRVEQFGAPGDAAVFLAIHNPASASVEARLLLWPLELRNYRGQVRELVHGLAIRVTPDSGREEVRPDTLTLTLPGKATAIVRMQRETTRASQ